MTDFDSHIVAQGIHALFSKAQVAVVYYEHSEESMNHKSKLTRPEEIIALGNCIVYDEDSERKVLSPVRLWIHLYSREIASPLYLIDKIGVIPRPCIRHASTNRDYLLTETTQLLDWLQRYGFHDFLDDWPDDDGIRPREKRFLQKLYGTAPYPIFRQHWHEMFNFEPLSGLLWGVFESLREGLLQEGGSSERILPILLEWYGVSRFAIGGYTSHENYIEELIASFSLQEFFGSVIPLQLTPKQKYGMSRCIGSMAFSRCVEHSKGFSLTQEARQVLDTLILYLEENGHQSELEQLLSRLKSFGWI